MTKTITSQEVSLALRSRCEIALLDLREEAVFATGHPLFAAQMSLSRLELEIGDRVPRRDCPIVLLDAGNGLVERAAARLAVLGYSNVAALEGGLGGWRAAGFELFEDVNSYSKAFGELVEVCRHTPSLSAIEVQALLEEDADVVVVDVRRFDEYTTMNIPGSSSLPGAELVLRAPELAPDADTTIIVNCAGRTRSIIGTQSLINAGLPNRVVALRNGTIGWNLAGQTLTYGQTRHAPAAPAANADIAVARARAVSYRAGVRRLAPDELSRMALDPARTLYRFDVRSPEEYDAGHIAGFRSAPGGQLLQEIDVFAPVRGGRIVLADDLGPRADMTASWLAQMGWEAYVLDGGFDGAIEIGPWRPTYPALPVVTTITPAELARRLDTGACRLIDLAPSRGYRAGHIPHAAFAIRAQLATVVQPTDLLVFTSPDGVLAQFACAEWQTYAPAVALAGGTAAWAAAGLPLESGMARALVEPADIYKRPYEGTDNAQEAMQAYLDWEARLVAQLERDGTHGFYVI